MSERSSKPEQLIKFLGGARRPPGIVPGHGASRELAPHTLPGVYWLNVFGPSYIDLIGERRLVDAPADAVRRRGEHIVIRTYGNAEDWEVHDRTRHVLAAALGAEHFFDRDDPTRQHQAPDFDLPELPERPPLRVQTEDGNHFTPLQ